jgi:hypothetical protein
MALKRGFRPRFDLRVGTAFPGGVAASRWYAFLLDDHAQDTFEYALALALFAMVAHCHKGNSRSRRLTSHDRRYELLAILGERLLSDGVAAGERYPSL